MFKIEIAPRLLGIPKGTYIEYFGKLDDGRYFVIFRPTKEWNYTDFRLAVGTETEGANNLRTIAKVVRYRDGGTTDIDSEIGKFHFPSGFNPEEKPTLNNIPITVFEIDKRDF